MKVKKDGFCLKLAYGWSEKCKMPKNVSACLLFRRCLGGAIMWLLWYIALAAVGVIMSFLFLMGFSFGCRPGFYQNEYELFLPYDRWPLKVSTPNIFCPGGNVCLWTVAVAIGFVMGLPYCLYRLYPVAIAHPHEAVTVGFWILGIVVASVFLGLLLKLRETEIYLLVKEYLRAKKEKVCPMVEVVE